MMLKGDKFPLPGSPRIQAVATSETPTGPFKVYPKPAISDFDTEDASIWYDKTRQRFYAMFHAHTYFGMITSTEGASWTKAKYKKENATAILTIPMEHITLRAVIFALLTC